MEGERLAVTSKEAAELLGISQQTLARLVKQGKIPVVRFDRKVRYRVGALEDWLRQSEGPGEKREAR